MNEFCKKYGLTDVYTYTDEETEQINNVLKGKTYDGDNCKIIEWIGSYYEHEKEDCKIALKYYLQAYDKGSNTMTLDIHRIYDDINKHDLAEKYLLLSLKNNNGQNFNCAGCFYYKYKKYDLAEKYLLLAIQNNYVASYKNLAETQCVQEKYDLAIKYYLLGIQNGDSSCIPKICHYVTSPLKRYIHFLKITNPIINFMITPLKTNQLILNYINRKNLLSKQDECPICFENTLLIPATCAHFYCESCYVMMDKCFCGNVL